jgi:hypothetical protein
MEGIKVPTSPRRVFFVLLMVALFALGVLANMSAPLAQGAPAGVYKGALKSVSDMPIITLKLTPSNNPDQVTVTGSIHVPNRLGADAEVTGTYYVSRNTLAASGRQRTQSEDAVTLDGKWDAAKGQLEVTVSVDGRQFGQPAILRKLGEGAEPEVDVELRPVATRAGAGVAGEAVLKFRNFPDVEVEVFANLSSLLNGKTSTTAGGGRQKFRVSGTKNVTVYLADLALTAPEPSEDDRLEIVVLVGYRFFGASQRVQITTGQATPLTIRNLRSNMVPTGALSGSFALNYRVQSGRSAKTDFTITETVSVTPVGGGAKKDLWPVSWTGSAPSLQSTTKNGEIGQHAFTVEQPGDYYIDYEISGPEVSPVKGRYKVSIGTPVGGGANQPPPQPGKLSGTVTADRSMVNIGDPVMVTVKTTMSGREDAEAEEVVELFGPKGNVITTSRKKRQLSSKLPKVSQFQVDPFEPGTYTIKVRVGGSETDAWSGEASFTVNEKAGTGPTGQTNPPAGEQGTFGLVKKEVGRAASPETGPYGAISGSITETSVQIKWTAIRDYEGTFTYQANLATPPAILKPGEIYELAVNATASRSSANQPYHGAGTRYYVEGSAETIENTSAFSGSASNGQFYSSGAGKLRFKVGTGGTIKLYSTVGSMLWGSDGIWSPCVYTYQWNAVPTVNPGAGAGGGEAEKTGTTGMTQLTEDDQEENAVLQAWLDTNSITLRAGEPSSIVHVHIKGYRRRTEDRVEVVFPQKTDNWASLPGAIVVNGGDGSYWPPQMATPEHIDGYFFSARSTAQASTQVIDIIVRQRKAGEVRLKLTVNVIPKGGTGPAGATVAPNWTGEWDSNVDQLQMMQEKDDVFGFFFIDGETYVFEAKLNGRTISFTYSSDKAIGGTGVLTLSEDGKTFTGKRIDDKTKKETEWKGTRK